MEVLYVSDVHYIFISNWYVEFNKVRISIIVSTLGPCVLIIITRMYSS